jgi:hypothetical protein
MATTVVTAGAAPSAGMAGRGMVVVRRVIARAGTVDAVAGTVAVDPVAALAVVAGMAAAVRAVADVQAVVMAGADTAAAVVIAINRR